MFQQQIPRLPASSISNVSWILESRSRLSYVADEERIRQKGIGCCTPFSGQHSTTTTPLRAGVHARFPIPHRHHALNVTPALVDDYNPILQRQIDLQFNILPAVNGFRTRANLQCFKTRFFYQPGIANGSRVNRVNRLNRRVNRVYISEKDKNLTLNLSNYLKRIKILP
ncbi:hypothetical protein LXL04_008980 [Taraxacum kok-saghyz]